MEGRRIYILFYFFLIIKIYMGRPFNKMTHIKSGDRNSFLSLIEKNFTLVFLEYSCLIEGDVEGFTCTDSVLLCWLSFIVLAYHTIIICVLNVLRLGLGYC